MQWTSTFYQPVLRDVCGDERANEFVLREHDYVFGNHKFGGNAQGISKDRWVHHTSFLWDFDPNNMKYLQLPEKQPDYREQRTHEDFLVRLSSCTTKSGEDMDVFFDAVQRQLSHFFEVVGVDSSGRVNEEMQAVLLSEAQASLGAGHRQATRMMEPEPAPTE
jgi:lipoate-protein ligase A